MINSRCNDFLRELSDLIKRAKLPACVVRMGLTIALDQVRELEIAAIQQETEQAAKKAEQETREKAEQEAKKAKQEAKE